MSFITELCLCYASTTHQSSFCVARLCHSSSRMQKVLECVDQMHNLLPTSVVFSDYVENIISFFLIQLSLSLADSWELGIASPRGFTFHGK